MPIFISRKNDLADFVSDFNKEQEFTYADFYIAQIFTKNRLKSEIFLQKSVKIGQVIKSAKIG
jgi:hypothetical protein